MDDLNKLSAFDAVNGIRKKRFTSQQLMADCITRIEKREPSVRAWAHFDPKHAMAEAKKADLENKRSSWRALGFIASLSIVLVALSWTSYDVAIRQALNFEADLLEDEEIPVNVVTPPPPPDAFIKIGNPIFLQSSLASLISFTPPFEPSITGRPFSFAIFLA